MLTDAASPSETSARLCSDRAGSGEAGYVLALTALLLIPITVFVGFAVDLGAWNARASQIQAASEAAALAGVTYMPNFAEAEIEAQKVAAQNGFDPTTDPDITVTVEPVGDSKNALRVIIEDSSVDRYFTSVVVDDLSIERKAVAEYVRPVEMGAPVPYAGNDPVSGLSPGYWLVTFGQNSPKGQGDRFHTANCSSALIGCAGSANAEFVEDGYFFLAKVPTVPPSGDLVFQAFDPFFYDHANNCNSTGTTNGDRNSGAWLPTDPAADAWFSTNFNGDPVRRFQRGSSNADQWCSGDSNGDTNPEEQTTFIVREPSDDPFDPTGGAILCAATYGNIDMVDLTGDGNVNVNDFKSRLLSSAVDGPNVLVESGGSVEDNLTFEEGWRRWVEICRVPAGTLEAGDYVVQVRSNASPSNPNNAGGAAGQGNNRYSLRFGADTGATDAMDSVIPDGTGLTMGAVGRLPIFVNQGGTSVETEFYLARVGPEYAGEVLTLDFFDITDGGQIDSLEVVPPPDATYDPGSGTVTLAEFPNCDFFRDSDATGPVEITGVFGGSGVGLISGRSCAMGAQNGAGNGYAFVAEVEIPPTYSCTDSDPAGCFLRVKVNYGSTPQDTTTWSAGIGGDPVRLTG